MPGVFLSNAFVVIRWSGDRLEIRARDPQAVSDGRWEIYLAQKESFQPPSELEPSQLITLATEQSIAMLLGNLATSLDLQ